MPRTRLRKPQTPQLTPLEKSGALTIFRKWDVEGDGFLDLQEFKRVFGAVGFPTDKVDALFHEADWDKNGRVEYEEFLFWLDSGSAGDDADVVFDSDAESEDEAVVRMADIAQNHGRWRRFAKGRMLLRLRQMGYGPLIMERTAPLDDLSETLNVEEMERTWSRSLAKTWSRALAEQVSPNRRARRALEIGEAGAVQALLPVANENDTEDPASVLVQALDEPGVQTPKP